MNSYEEIKARLGRPIAFYPALVSIAGSVTGAVWLSQLLYWSKRGADPKGWIYKSRKDWERETGVGRSAQEAVRERLIKLQILQEDLRGWPAKVHFLLNFEKLSEAICYTKSIVSISTDENAGSRQEEDKSDKLLVSVTKNQFVENQQTRSESAPKITQRAESNLQLPLPEDLSFSQFSEPIQRSIARVWALASLNPRQNPELDRSHLRRARIVLDEAVERGIESTAIAAAIADAAWPSKIVPALQPLIDLHECQRRSNQIDAARVVESEEIARAIREAHDWLQSLIDEEREEITAEFLRGQSVSFVQIFRAKPNALRCRAAFDPWLIARFAAQNPKGERVG